MENEVILFQNTEQSNFKSDRLRKNIKASLKEVGIQYATDKLALDANVVYFLPPFDIKDVESAKDAEKKIVVFSFYTEDEKVSAISNIRKTENITKLTIKPQYLKALRMADLVYVPSDEFKKILTSNGIGIEKIKILPAGANISIYKYLPEDDLDLARRYYFLKEDEKIILAFGSPKDKKLMTALKKISSLRQDCKVLLLVSNKDDAKISKFNISRFFSKTNQNLVITYFTDINLYRSLLKNARVLLVLNSVLADPIQIAEAMASELQVIGYDRCFARSLLEKNVVLHYDSEKELITGIMDYIDYKTLGTISEAFFYINDLNVGRIGEIIKSDMQTLQQEEN